MIILGVSIDPAIFWGNMEKHRCESNCARSKLIYGSQLLAYTYHNVVSVYFTQKHIHLQFYTYIQLYCLKRYNCNFYICAFAYIHT